ncbi:shikimate kinase [Mangrovimonas aestuarii]|uniref:shikimate kinase n=1 Tax=Mangrovimonas aestuarii TaxID=3018443 RepID=UPI002378F2A0|nr:shikimate kinase [Mangrovimonas aestuarii]
MKIVLLGYMGSGKSVVGKILAEKLQVPYIDLDDYISDKEEMEIPELFKSKGEIYFRKKENKYLNTVLKDKKEDFVLSLGGGTPCYANNMNILLSDGSVNTIYLKASVAELANRLFDLRTDRPLLSNVKDKEDLVDFIGKHLFERTYYYNQAKLTVDVNGKSPQETLEGIISLLA